MPDIRDMSYEKLLLDALRIVPYKKGDVVLTNANIVKAVTMNENLGSLGFTLKPSDLVEMAASSSLDGFYDKVSSMMSTVKAKPMYPDFPTQVMNMDEAQFRFHQMVHYFSTYGIGLLTGQEVLHGWLPAEAGLVSDTEKTETDDRLLQAEAIGLIDEKEMYTVPFEQILSKRERMTDMEREIVKRCALSSQIDFSRKYAIPFKKNLEDIFSVIAEAGASGKISRQEASNMLYNICQHPGDVTRNVHRYLAAHKYHLRTAEKKMFIDVYERYTPAAFRENISVSNRNRDFVREIFKHIDFAKYAHNQEMVRSLREIDSLYAWEGRARKKIEQHGPDAIRFAAQRPGMMLRMISFALRNGYSQEEIFAELVKQCGQLSMQTLVSQLNLPDKVAAPMGYIEKKRAAYLDFEKASRAMNCVSPDDHSKKAEAIRSRFNKTNQRFGAIETDEARRSEEAQATRPAQKAVCRDVLKAKMEILDTPIRGKNIYLNQDVYCFDKLAADPSKKSMSQGYLPRDVVKKIPDDAKAVRFFVYWNDSCEVDVDLHVRGITRYGRPIHVGWYGDYSRNGITHSGDITHSDAAEYIDINFANSDAKEVSLDLDLYDGRDNFSQLAECYGGVMAVNRMGENVQLYDAANCLFRDDIKNPCQKIKYATIDVPAREIRYHCLDMEIAQMQDGQLPILYSLDAYLRDLADAQGAVIVDTPEEADMILTLTKPLTDKEFSLIDANYFYDSPVLEQERERERPNNVKSETKEFGSEMLDADTISGLVLPAFEDAVKSPEMEHNIPNGSSRDADAKAFDSNRITIPQRHATAGDVGHHSRRSGHGEDYDNR